MEDNDFVGKRKRTSCRWPPCFFLMAERTFGRHHPDLIIISGNPQCSTLLIHQSTRLKRKRAPALAGCMQYWTPWDSEDLQVASTQKYDGAVGTRQGSPVCSRHSSMQLHHSRGKIHPFENHLNVLSKFNSLTQYLSHKLPLLPLQRQAALMVSNIEKCPKFN